MSVIRFHKPGADFRREPKISRFALLSLILHLGIAVLFSGILIRPPVREHRPVYYVDLSQLPVANPRAGRPDGAAQPADKPPAPKAAAPVQAATPAPPPVQPPKPAAKPPEPEKPAPAKPQPEKTVAAKPKPEKPAAVSGTQKSATAKTGQKTASTPPKSSGTKAETEKDYQQTLDAIQAMQAKAEREALKEKLAALATKDTRGSGSGSGSDVPLGMPDGKGDEAGISQELWLQTWLKQNWSFSKYQATRRDLEATTRIVYDAEGNLVKYEFVKKSGDSNFDDSVTKAILKGRQLAFQPGRRIDVEVIFNLKDLMD